MRYLLPFLTTGGLLQQRTIALPQPQGDAGNINYEQDAEAENAGNAPPPPLQPSTSPPAPALTNSVDTTSTSSSVSSSASGYGDNTASASNTCVLFDPPDMVSTLQMCKNVCGDAVAKQVASGDTSSVSCISFTPLGLNPEIAEPGYHNEEVTPGNCSCNEPLIDMLADTYINALPVIAEIGCEILVTAFQYVAEAGALAIPGGGEAIDGGMIAGISAAKLASYSYDAGSAGLGAFQSWAKPCETGGPAVIPKGGFKIPPNLPKGGGKPGDAGDPGPAPAPPQNPALASPKEPAPAPAKGAAKEKPKAKPNPTHKETDKSIQTSKPSDQACDIQKRVIGKNKNTACDDSKHVSSITIPDQKSKAVPKTNRVICSAAVYGQACFNYYSVIKNGVGDQADGIFTCSDSQSTFRGRELTATRSWKSQHNSGYGWSKYTTDGYVFVGAETRTSAVSPRCQADEWPPAYFRSAEQAGQLVRWLPGSENGGAGQLWRDWCVKNDGGLGNGQLKDGKLNPDLVKTIGDRLGSHTITNGATTTTFESYSAEITRGVFSMDFDWTGCPLNGKKPDDSNDWGLRLNPCWPQAIVPDDPGFVLQTGDPWYVKHPPKPDVRKEYSSSPIPASLVQSANDWLNAHPNYQAGGVKASNSGQKRPAPDSDDNNGSKKNQKGNGRGSSSSHERSIDMVNNKLAIREFNTIRKLTEEEIKRNVEIIQCADRTCSQERRSYDEKDGVFVIPGTAPPTSPPANVNAVPTGAAQAVTGGETRAFRRRSASPELPEATATPSL